jgi:hypothetical protein
VTCQLTFSVSRTERHRNLPSEVTNPEVRSGRRVVAEFQELRNNSSSLSQGSLLKVGGSLLPLFAALSNGKCVLKVMMLALSSYLIPASLP